MKKAKQLLENYLQTAEKILVEFSVDEKSATGMLAAFKEELCSPEAVDGEGKELFEVCLYNVLATINTVPNQARKSAQLIAALTEAKEEIKEICSFFDEQ